jgi:hypothetical protein
MALRAESEFRSECLVVTVRTRVLVLAILFAGLLAIHVTQQFLARSPREPRMIFVNNGSSDIDRLVIETASRKIDLGRVKAGGAVVLPVEPQSGEIYFIDGNEFSGFEMVHYVQIARQARADVHLGVDEDGCGWIEHDHPIRNHGFPSKRRVTPVYPPPGASY